MAKLLQHVSPVNILLLSYRGYGKSQGKPSQTGILMDAQSALDRLMARHSENETPTLPIYLYGQSLGGAVAIALLERNPTQVHGLIIENAFWSMIDLVSEVMPPLRVFPKHLLALMLTEPWKSGQSLVRALELNPYIHVLILVGMQDELISPHAHSFRLWQAIATNDQVLAKQDLASITESKYENSMFDSLVKELTPKEGPTGALQAEATPYYRQLGLFPHGTHNDTCVQKGYLEMFADFVENSTAKIN